MVADDEGIGDLFGGMWWHGLHLAGNASREKPEKGETMGKGERAGKE